MSLYIVQTVEYLLYKNENLLVVLKQIPLTLVQIILVTVNPFQEYVEVFRI